MDIKIEELNGNNVAELISDKIEISNAQDALEMMMNCIYQGASSIIVYRHNLVPDFFDLKTGVAGEILQKFSTYNARLAIVGDFNEISSKSLRDFIYESNQQGRINFVATTDKAKEKFSK